MKRLCTTLSSSESMEPWSLSSISASSSVGSVELGGAEPDELRARGNCESQKGHFSRFTYQHSILVLTSSMSSKPESSPSSSDSSSSPEPSSDSELDSSDVPWNSLPLSPDSSSSESSSTGTSILELPWAIASRLMGALWFSIGFLLFAPLASFVNISVGFRFVALRVVVMTVFGGKGSCSGSSSSLSRAARERIGRLELEAIRV